MSENNKNKSYYEMKMKQQRRLAKKKRRQQRLMILFALFVVVIFILVLIIKGISSVIIANKIPESTPIPIITETGKILNTKENNAEDIPTHTPEPEKKDILPDAQTQNDILKFLESSGSAKKVCYLTFDDGPNNSVTPKILDILRKYNIKATFFQVGTLIEENTDVAQRVYEEGHLIGGHSYDHTYSKIYSDAHGFADEMNKCIKLIQEISGDDYFPVIRFPGGSFNSGTYGEQKQEYKELLAKSGIYHCDWNALNGDAEGNSKSVEQLLERTKKSSAGKNQVVVLMHDSTTKKNTVAALPDIIEYFISEGYTFSTLDKPILE